MLIHFIRQASLKPQERGGHGIQHHILHTGYVIELTKAQEMLLIGK